MNVPRTDLSFAMQQVPCPLCGESASTFERCVRGFALTRCQICGMVYVNPQPSPETLAAGYSGNSPVTEWIGGPPDKARFYETWFSPRDRQRWTKVIARLETHVGRGWLLEYGCGPALVGQIAAERGWQVEGIDLGEWIRELQPKRSFPLRVGTLAQQDWPDGHFDAIYAQDVLEHLQHPLDELRELARLLRSGGMIYVHVPNYASLTIHLGVSRFAYNEPLGHLNYFTPRTLAAMLRRAGFTRVRLHSDHLEYQDFVHREPFDYGTFEAGLATVGGRQTGGRLWAAARNLLNVPLDLFKCGTYLWGFAQRL